MYLYPEKRIEKLTLYGKVFKRGLISENKAYAACRSFSASKSAKLKPSFLSLTSRRIFNE